MKRLLVVAFLMCALGASAEIVTWPTAVAAADSTYELPADTARMFHLGDLPTGEVTITESGAYPLAGADKCEARADGDAEVSFWIYRSGATYLVYANVTMGSATSVKTNYWDYD